MSRNGQPPRGITAQFRAWTAAEDAALRERFPTEEVASLARALGRTEGSVFHRVQRLRLRKRLRWTPADDARLRELWGELTLARIARELGRSSLTTYWRAEKLKLPRGCPQGREAAKRGIAIPARPRRRRAHWRIASAVLDQVVAEAKAERSRRGRLETLGAASKRTGVGRPTLAGWLHGLPLEIVGRAKLVRPELVDRIVEEHRQRKNCRARGRAA